MRTKTHNTLCMSLILITLLSSFITVHLFWRFRSRKPDTTVSLSFAPSGFCFSIRVFRVTAYCPCEKCCGQFADGITASGHKIQTGDKFVAASNLYPFGTLMFVPGYSDNLVVVQDRGGVIKDGRLDVFFPTHRQALEWGVKMTPVKIYRRERK